MRLRFLPRLFVIFAPLALSGCYADGNSEFLSKGEVKRFLTMSACEKEAKARYHSGGPVYGGFECRYRVAGFILETRGYENGERVR